MDKKTITITLEVNAHQLQQLHALITQWDKLGTAPPKERKRKQTRLVRRQPYPETWPTGTDVKVWRIRKRLTQVEAAKLAGLHQADLSNMERSGDRPAQLGKKRRAAFFQWWQTQQ